MEQYIPKSALVEEIESYKNSFCDRNGYLEDSETNGLAYDTLCELEDSIDTLEVKEVDLEKEIKNEIDEYWYDNDYGAIQLHGGTITMEVSDVKEIAKHFFELGLFSLLTWKDVKLISEIGNDFMNSEESDDLSEEDYYKEILNRFEAQKGKKIWEK